MKIAFVTSDDPRDKRTWSGIPYHMARALEKHCGEVGYLGPVRPLRRVVGSIRKRITKALVGRNYDHLHSLSLAREYGDVFRRKIEAESFDAVFAPAACTEIAFLDVSVPIAYSSDTTFALVKDYYDIYSNLLDTSIREGHFVEEAAIQKARLLIYPSEWAAESAVRDYGADRSKIRVIPFGANLEEIPPRESVLQKKKSDRCELLFVGVDWVRKGGEIAVETLVKLREMGVPAQLTVCGCTPPTESARAMLTVIPFIDKHDDAQRRRLVELYSMSDFFLLPTRAESFGIVFCEASAFGLPAITTDTGGVSGVVRDGENGFMLPLSAGASEYARLISELWRDCEAYSALAHSSRAAFEQRLNWDAWGAQVNKLLAAIC